MSCTTQGRDEKIRTKEEIGKNMLDEFEKKEELKELEEYLVQIRDVREWKRVEAVRLRLKGESYKEIQQRF